MTDQPETKESIVCPYCGMSTWVDGRCALPGCEGSTVLYVVQRTEPESPFLNVGEGEYGMPNG